MCLGCANCICCGCPGRRSRADSGLCSVVVEEPDALGANLDESALDLATTEPSVNGLAVSADAIGIFLEGDLAIMLARDVSLPDRSCRAKSAPLKREVHLRGVDAVLLGLHPPLGVRGVRYARAGPTLGAE